jgi:hypothetical protein
MTLAAGLAATPHAWRLGGDQLDCVINFRALQNPIHSFFFSRLFLVTPNFSISIVPIRWTEISSAAGSISATIVQLCSSQA